MGAFVNYVTGVIVAVVFGVALVVVVTTTIILIAIVLCLMTITMPLTAAGRELIKKWEDKMEDL